MTTKVKPGKSQGFLASYTDRDLKQAIAQAVAATAYEYSLLDERHPQSRSPTWNAWNCTQGSHYG